MSIIKALNMTVLQLKKKIQEEVIQVNDAQILQDVLALLAKDNTKPEPHWSSFAGTIPFKGDSLKFQQKLRAEWGD